jgi:hypothetical protein
VQLLGERVLAGAPIEDEVEGVREEIRGCLGRAQEEPARLAEEHGDEVLAGILDGARFRHRLRRTFPLNKHLRLKAMPRRRPPEWKKE